MFYLHLGCTRGFTDIAIVMDISDNNSPEQFNTQLKAVSYLISRTKIGYGFTLFSFSTLSNTYRNIFSFNQYKSAADMISLVNVVSVAQGVKRSNMASILSYMGKDGFSTINGARSSSRKIVMTVSAGKFNDDEEDIDSAVQNLKDDGIVMVAIGGGLNANLKNLLSVSNDPSFTYILGDDTNINVLESLRTLIEYDFCSHMGN